MALFKALVTAEVDKDVLESAVSNDVEFVYDGYSIDHEVMDHERLKRIVGNYDILVCEYDTVSEDVLNEARNLKLIICCRGGVKSVIDLECAKSKGIIVCNNAGRNANSLADLVMGFILDMTRNITLTNKLIHSRVLTSSVSTKPGEYKDIVWGLNDDSPFQKYRGKAINEMTIGIIGFGNTGRMVAYKAHLFDMNVIVYDHHSDYKEHPDYVKFVSLNTLLENSDIISVNCSVNDESRGMCNSAFFDAMKNGSYFINTARGELVVEADLAVALKSGKLAGAALDVTAKEPIPSDSILLDVPNLILTPHIAGSSHDVQAKGTAQVIDSLKSWLDGVKPRYAVVYPR